MNFSKKFWFDLNSIFQVIKFHNGNQLVLNVNVENLIIYFQVQLFFFNFCMIKVKF